MDIELVSNKICPFVQSAVIALLHKKYAFKISYIDLFDPPLWFMDISPLGRVPLLKVNNEHVIFDSAVINDFLDEITPGSLLPADPVQRAMNRSWIQFSSTCILDLTGMLHAQKAEIFATKHDTLCSKFMMLEKTLAHGRYFNGDQLSLVDFAFAPLFIRIEYLDLGEKLYPAKQFPKTERWSRELLKLDAVKKSVPKDFVDLLRQHISAKAPYAAQALFGELVS